MVHTFLVDDVRILSTKVPKLAPRDASFAESMLAYYDKKKVLSLPQRQWVTKLIAKADAIVPATTKPVVLAVNLSRITELFATASKSLKTPRIFLPYNGKEFVLSVAGAQARQPGTINVVSRGSFDSRDWYGRISLEGNWEPSAIGKTCAELEPMLTELASNPLETMKIYGRKFGNCCLCGRELTNPVSISNGIGPICAEKFGF